MVQLIGFAAFAMDTVGCHLKKGRNILLLSIPSLGFWSAHFALLGGLTGAMMCLATGIRTILCLFCPPSARRYIFAGGLCAIFVSTFISWQGFISLLPCIGAICYCFSVLRPDCAKTVRICWASSTFFWLIYGILVGSVPEVAASSIGLASVALALWRQNMPTVSGPEKVSAAA